MFNFLNILSLNIYLRHKYNEGSLELCNIKNIMFLICMDVWIQTYNIFYSDGLWKIISLAF